MNVRIAQLRKQAPLPYKIFKSSTAASLFVAEEIAGLIRQKAALKENCVLGLATGSTPTAVYDELVRMHREEGLSFRNVVSFNLDEYYPIAPDALQSYVRFMNEYLFDHVDIPADQIFIPDGTILKEDVEAYCRNYEGKIKSFGGIDLQLLGIGRTGHIGFNEPGSGIHSRTQLITLDNITKVDAASDFFGEEHVPLKAITMGVGTILEAKRILLMAWGEGKASIIKEAIEGPINDVIPATYLQNHSNVKAILDDASSAELSTVKTPWLFEEINWDNQLIKRAVIWLSLKMEKPILKLTNKDYMNNKLGGIITQFDSAYNVNLEVFKQIKQTITGWPGGKAGQDDRARPERALPIQKRVVLFSPHPDDDVISMGGTFLRLVDQHHEVHVAYQTSGNIAVDDDDVIRFLDFVNDFHTTFGMKEELSQAILKNVQKQLANKKPGQVDAQEILQLKGMIRAGEAKAGCRYVGIPDEQAHFLNLPFYETGLVKKKPLGVKDVQIIVDLLQEIQPHQIYAAGDLSDPHGTHRVCLNAIFKAIEQLKQMKAPWLKDCYVWLYRGAWQEWRIDDIDMAIPISPEELMRKRKAIFKHQSQKDAPLFPGHDSREFWQRAEARNRNTAQTYDLLGFPEYEAIEAFKRYYF